MYLKGIEEPVAEFQCFELFRYDPVESSPDSSSLVRLLQNSSSEEVDVARPFVDTLKETPTSPLHFLWPPLPPPAACSFHSKEVPENK